MAIITSVKERISQLNQADFQILCDALLSKEGYPGIVSLGTKEGAAKTTRGTPDTYFCSSDGKYIFAEYTTQKEGLTRKIRDDLNKCLDENSIRIPLNDISEIIYCHSSSNIKPSDDLAFKNLCEEKGVKLSLIGIDILAAKLMNHPSILKDHLGLNVDSEQIQTLEAFIKQYDSNTTAAPLNTTFLSREKEYDAIEKCFDETKIVLLVGPAGIGKTRLALEYAKKHSNNYNEELLCIHNRSLPMYEDIKLYFEKPGKYFVFIDDANQLSELRHVLEYVNKEDEGYNVHILMTVRDYAVSKVRGEMSGLVRYEIITLMPFTDEEISSLMKGHYGIINSVYLERIIQIAEGNARIAMFAGKIASDTNRLDSINDVSDLYSEYFGRVLKESGVTSNSSLLITAGIMAFLNSIHLDHINPLLPILEEKGLSQKDFLDNIRVLHEQEIVDVCNDKGAHFSEQCMANYVLKYVFVDQKVIKLSSMIEVCFDNYRERTINAIATLLGVFRNVELHDYVGKEILDLWNKLENEESPTLFEFLKAFFPANEVKALRAIQKLIDADTSVIMKAEEINTEEGKNYAAISNDIIAVLGGFAHLENFDTAMDLFIQYYLKRPDLYMQFYHASTTFFSIDKHSAENGYKTQIIFFTKLSEYLHHEDNSLIALLFCNVARHYLNLEFSPSESTRDGKGVTFYRIPIILSEGTKEYRRLIWEQLIELSSKEAYSQGIKDVLRSYGKTIHDCSKEVIKSEADLICKLSKRQLSPDRLEDCLIAESIQNVFDVAEYYTEELLPFFHNPKYKLYEVINGPKYTDGISYEERKIIKENHIENSILTAPNRIEAFNSILELYVEAFANELGLSYKIAKGIDITLQALSDSKDEYLRCASMLLSSETIDGIEINHIVETLFTMLPPKAVFELLNNSCLSCRNKWLFAYYREIPESLINEIELEGLYNFLADASDGNIQSCPYRDIRFLDKFLPFDDSVIIKASKIILKKKEYSPFIVCLYFEPQFNEYNICPQEVVEKFRLNIKLLEQIYLFVLENGCLFDCQGSFLQILFEKDKEFVKEFSKWFIKKAKMASAHEYQSILEVYYQEEEYLDCINYLVDESIKESAIPRTHTPWIMKLVLAPYQSGKELCEKVDYWVKNYIANHSDDIGRMELLFEALTETSMERAMEYVAYLISCTDDYDVFKTIPLTPRSYSYTGSSIPLYSSWIDNLKKLLPLFSGLKFIGHKDRVQNLIEIYRKMINDEEISEILNG